MNAQFEKDLSGAGVWLNAPASTVEECRGRPVALAFVSATSAWCVQRLADLGRWQATNPGKLQLIVIAVPRFDFEREPAQALKLVRRLGVSAPILLDHHWQAWQRFSIGAWPTVVLIDDKGEERERLIGAEGDLERSLNQLCEGAVSQFDGGEEPVESQPEPRSVLRFPMGLVATAERLYIADSGHHRVLECNHEGRVLQQFGIGTPDFIDGDRNEAAFNRPQGLALDREYLYVADTGNHALRRIHLLSGRVDTLCGHGRAADPVEGVVAQARDHALNHPVGIAVAGNQIHIAMAGANQIWSYDLGTRALRWRAGAGALEVRDGSGHMAAFAQPVALAAVQQALYVADSLGSAVRSVQLRGDVVQTLVGGSVWEFGAADGPRAQARLQYPQAIALGHESPFLWVADTGNGSLRMLRLGGGDLGTVALPRRLQGPAALAVSVDAVWIAESDAHGILRYDLASSELRDVAIDG